MALPTLPTFLELKKVNFNQELLKNKHAHEFEQMQKWSDTRKYFQTTTNQSQLHTNWTSDKSFNNSMFAYTQQQDSSVDKIAERLKLLNDRRARLKCLVESEKAEQEVALRSLRTSSAGSTVSASASAIDSLRRRSEALKSAREQDRRQLAEQKLYENFRLNNPELRELESKKMESNVVEAWSEQIREKSELAKAEKKADEEYLAYLEVEKQKQADKDEELRRLKLNREAELRDLLKQQMIELRQREAETEVCLREEAALVRQRDNIEQMLEERRLIVDKSRREEYGRQLLRQHKTKLRQKARQVQNELEFDMKIMDAISKAKDEEKYVDQIRRDEARATAQGLLESLRRQLMMEKEREAELEAMFADEASREAEKRAAVWEREREARELLMREVMEERAIQINEKAVLLAQKKTESMQKREDLLRDMEQTQAIMKRERDKSELVKLERRKELEKDIERENRLKVNLVEDIGEAEVEKINLRGMDKLVEAEKAKIVEQPFQPKSYGRKKVAWN